MPVLARKEFSIAGTFTGQVDVGELREMRVEGLMGEGHGIFSSFFGVRV